MKGVRSHPEEALEFGLATARLEVDKEKLVIAFDAMRLPGTHRIAVEDMINYFGPKGRFRADTGNIADSFLSGPRSANTLWAAVRNVL